MHKTDYFGFKDTIKINTAFVADYLTG